MAQFEAGGRTWCGCLLINDAFSQPLQEERGSGREGNGWRNGPSYPSHNMSRIRFYHNSCCDLRFMVGPENHLWANGSLRMI